MEHGTKDVSVFGAECDGTGVFIYGFQEWIPVPGDFDGDGDADPCLFYQD